MRSWFCFAVYMVSERLLDQIMVLFRFIHGK